MGSPTSLTINYLRSQGINCGVVERWIPQAKRRIDLLGFIDIVALDKRVIGIQATSFSNMSSRINKIVGEQFKEATDWLNCGGEIQVWTWLRRKRNKTDARGRVRNVLTDIARVSIVDKDVLRTGEYDWTEIV